MERRGDSWTAYALWCVAGAGLALGVLTILSVGPFVLLVTLTLCGWLLWRVDFGWGMLGLLSGAGLPVLFVGWVAGLAWWPFVLLGVLLGAVGLVDFLRRRRT